MVNRRRLVPHSILQALPAQLTEDVKQNWATDADLAPILDDASESLYTSRVTFIALSPRETGVLTQLAKPMDRSAVGEALFISENTLKSHIRSIYRKLGVTNRAQAVMQARKSGLLHTG